MRSDDAFTFIELLITLAVIAIAFLPLMRMYSTCLEQMNESISLATARYLAQEGMERLKNLGYTQAQLEEAGDAWIPDLNEPPLEMNGGRWRVYRRIIRGSDPLEMRISVYQISEKKGIGARGLQKPMAEVVSLMEDLEWAGAG